MATTTTVSSGGRRIRPFTHKRNKPVSEFVDNNFALDRKIKEALQGLQPSCQWSMLQLPRVEDKELIADFILQWPNDSNNAAPMAANTKKGYIDSLVLLAKHLQHKKSFKEMTREDIVDYLAGIKRSTDVDPTQKWVNTHNARLSCYLAFWKWLTQPDIPREQRQTPPQLKGYRFANRKVKTSVRHEDLWTDEEHKAFLDYCEDARLACYHAIAKDTGGRPGELLQLNFRY